MDKVEGQLDELERKLHHPVLISAAKRLITAGEEYNLGTIQREDYQVYPFRSWAHMCHFEATRLCSFAEAYPHVNLGKIQEHAADLVNYSVFIFDEADALAYRRGQLMRENRKREKEGKSR